MEQHNTIPAPITQPAFLSADDKPAASNLLLKIGVYVALGAIALLALKRLFG